MCVSVLFLNLRWPACSTFKKELKTDETGRTPSKLSLSIAHITTEDGAPIVLEAFALTASVFYAFLSKTYFFYRKQIEQKDYNSEKMWYGLEKKN